jgi:thioredoxin reductase (NADPH)
MSMLERDAQQIAFPKLDPDQIDALAEFATRRHLGDGESLFEVGDRGFGFFVVLSGAIEVAEPSTGELKTVAVHQPGEFTGDVDMLTGNPTVVSAVARGDTEVLEISSDDIRHILSARPVVGERILQAFITRRELLVESGFQGLRIIGSGASRDAFRVRDFLARNQVPFTWIDLDDNPRVGELLRHFGLSGADTPVVAYGTQPLLRNPSTQELAKVIGLKQSLADEMYDLVVVGAGPAGLAAAVYGSSEGLRTVVLDDSAPGGQAGASSKIENYLGFPTGISGAELASRATLQAQKFGTRFSTPSRVVGLICEGDYSVIQLDDGERVSTRCVLIATGAEYRKLDVPGREKFDGLGVYYAATQTELVACRGSEVVVVGGGNSAGQAAMFLSEQTQRVLLLLRGDDLRKGMSSYLAERIEETENVEVLCHTEVRRMLGEQQLEAVEIENTQTGERREVATPAVFTFIGATPRTDWLPPQIETDDKGFVKTGRSTVRSPGASAAREPFLLETSHPGIFAAGDARLGSVKRVASAGGEGSMAVKFVHEYLSDQ